MRLGPANRTAAFVPQAGADNSHGTVDRPTAAEFHGNQNILPFGPAPEAAMGSQIEDQQTALVGLCRGGGGHGSACCCARNSILAGKTGEGGNQAPRLGHQMNGSNSHSRRLDGRTLVWGRQIPKLPVSHFGFICRYQVVPGVPLSGFNQLYGIVPKFWTRARAETGKSNGPLLLRSSGLCRSALLQVMLTENPVHIRLDSQDNQFPLGYATQRSCQLQPPREFFRHSHTDNPVAVAIRIHRRMGPGPGAGTAGAARAWLFPVVTSPDVHIHCLLILRRWFHGSESFRQRPSDRGPKIPLSP